jgi:hypothetical protein
MISSAAAPASASGAERRLLHRAQGGLRDESQRALGAHHEVSEDLHGRVEVDEGVEAVAGRVLAAELPGDAPSEPCVGADLVTRPQQCLVKAGTEPTKLVVGAWRSGIDDAPISQNDDERV